MLSAAVVVGTLRVKAFVVFENVQVVNHSRYSPDLNPYDLFLLPRLKKMHSGKKFDSK